MASLVLESQGTDAKPRRKAPGRYAAGSSLNRAGSALKEQPWSPRKRSDSFHRCDPASQPEAGVPSARTAPLANHVHSPRGPTRANLYNLDEYVASPRRQLRRGDSCPPLRTDPITHSCRSPRTDPLALRQLDNDHLTQRTRSHRRTGYNAVSATGKLNLATHASSMDGEVERGTTESSRFNTKSLVSEEDIGPRFSRVETGPDMQPSPRYTRMNNLRELTIIHREGRRGDNAQLRESADFFHCMGLQDNRPSTAPVKEEARGKKKPALFRDPLRA